MQKIDRRYLVKIRYAVQWAVFGLIIWGGVMFYFFADHFISGGPLVERPPLVEGFLPIGALMSLKLWITNGVFDPVHPAGLAIFIAAIASSAILKKSFCGFICPVGALSEQAFKLGRLIFGRNFRIHKFIDYPLRSLKYILFAFFFYVIIIRMPAEGIIGFLDTPYWKIADVKMMLFFTEMTLVTAMVLFALFLLSLLFKNFWCRYLCPYGALAGLLSAVSPLKIARNEDHCIHCGKCSETCPNLIDVENQSRVWSPECTGCLTCVANCPSRGALDVSLPNRRALKPVLYFGLALIAFFGIIFIAKLGGHWESNVTYEEYRELVPIASRFDHP